MDKTYGELLNESLVYKRKKVSEFIKDKDEVEKFSDEYKYFLDNAKTERMATNYIINLLQQNGFECYDKNKKYNSGDKVYTINRGKSIICCVFGKEDLSNGINIIASHIDSPRLDLKPNPLYEEANIAFLKTHYYGGIKKYQWTAMPLALVGVIIKQDGTIVDVNIGLEEDDPVFCVTDLLPHLDNKQSKEPIGTAIKGEKLNVIFGIEPLKDEKVIEKVKLNILKILNEKYEIIEEDFISSEIEVVPAFKTKDVGLDRSMIGGYGHDDRVCAFTSIKSLIDINLCNKTSVVVLADKEEIGSTGNTGLESDFLKYFIYDISESEGHNGRDVLSKSKCFSADVSAGFDPNYSDVYEKNNSAYLNHGTSIMKYTGSRGKNSTSEASAEFMSYVRNLFNENNIIWQSCELGKVDAGGGGTVAMFIAKLNVDVVDIGVPVLSMHSPFEVISKNDMFMTYKAFKVFLQN